MTTPTPKQIDAILKHLPVLQNPSLSVSKWHTGKDKDGTISMPMEVHSPEVGSLVADLYKYEFVADFDWPSWQRSAEKYVEDSGRLQRATLGTLVKLLTTHVRKDRFCEGHFSEMVECGHIRAILERLAVLRAG
ncbi:MAG: DUF6508 domain-containing protein [Phycisphaerae bacterium]